jgi:hypothetical protein
MAEENDILGGADDLIDGRFRHHHHHEEKDNDVGSRPSASQSFR